MTLADFDAAGAAVLAWLLTYAIHSTILLAAAALAAWRFADHHAWLDVIWKTALVGTPDDGRSVTNIARELLSRAHWLYRANSAGRCRLQRASQ